MSNSICIHDLSPPLCSSLFTFTGAKKGFLASKGLKTNYQKNHYYIEFVEHSISCHRNSRTKLTVSGFQMILVWLFLPCSISLLTGHRVLWGYTGECWNQQNVSCTEKVLLTCTNMYIQIFIKFKYLTWSPVAFTPKCSHIVGQNFSLQVIKSSSML